MQFILRYYDPEDIIVYIAMSKTLFTLWKIHKLSKKPTYWPYVCKGHLINRQNYA